MEKIRTMLTVLGIILCCWVNAQNSMTKPSPEELRAINDSIVSEGYWLYLIEKAAWNATDLCLEQCANKDKAKGYVTLVVGKDSLQVLFYNMDEKKCVYSALYNLNSGDCQVSDDMRDLDSLEIKRIERRRNAYFKTPMYESAPDGKINLNFQVLDHNHYRVYGLQGTTFNHRIPFGNDSYCDFDDDGNILRQEKLHETYFPADMPLNTRHVKDLVHSHTADHPYITPTDIATFLLYGKDCFGLRYMYVYSTALDCFFKFDAENMSITEEKPSTDDTHEPFSFKKYESFVKNDRAGYDRLMERFKNADTTLTADEISMVYYGFSYTDSYLGSSSTSGNSVEKLVKNSEYEKAAILADSLLKKDPVNIKLIYHAASLWSELHNEEKKARYTWMYCRLLDTILDSGAGTEEDPMRVITISDEYVTMYDALRVTEFIGQTLSGCCDVMKVKSFEKETEVYFDISRSLMRTFSK